MRVLVVGSGGREHALVWAIAASPLVTKVYAAPGNPGTGTLAENVPIGAEDIPGLVRFALEQGVDLVVPGPEGPLVAGLADALAEAGIACCGPTAAAARLEGSKAFTKELCDEAGIPTALWERFDDAAAAIDFIRRRGAPLVVKADGLASGKGVVVAQTEAEAEAAVRAMMEEARFGAAGATLVIEECLVGAECSLFALCDGTDAVFLGLARDHKRVGDGDTGPNTGGMGAFSPVPGLDPAPLMDGFIRPALTAMAARGTPFRGILFAGLMLTEAGPRLIEYNVRFGDPECQAILPRLRSDLIPGLLAACQGELASFDLRFRDEACVAVVMAARGYPDAPETGTAIDGLQAAAAVSGALVFEAATRIEDGRLLASGGRVLTIGALGPSVEAARETAYAAIGHLVWPGGFCRRDIGATV
ncbi:MAG: phosphoribosylamine--glycine ligase [Acetobacteraceae bacterium]|nr:phosphoribosylamine--glycine ligase [Acetobacteraceae bacterium]